VDGVLTIVDGDAITRMSGQIEGASLLFDDALSLGTNAFVEFRRVERLVSGMKWKQLDKAK